MNLNILRICLFTNKEVGQEHSNSKKYNYCNQTLAEPALHASHPCDATVLLLLGAAGGGGVMMVGHRLQFTRIG